MGFSEKIQFEFSDVEFSGVELLIFTFSRVTSLPAFTFSIYVRVFVPGQSVTFLSLILLSISTELSR